MLKIIATFQPKRIDDLQGGAESLIGWRGAWMFCWIMDETDGGPYVGMKVYVPADHGVRLGWVPECDLADIEEYVPEGE